MNRRTVFGGALLAAGVPTGGRVAAATHAPATSSASLLALVKPALDSNRSLEQALQWRRSARSYTSEALSLPALSQLLWAAQGITAAGGLRTAPSAGALYPLELYLVAARVEGLARAVYRYVPASHALGQTDGQAGLSALAKAAFGQEAIAQAAAVVVIAAVDQRTARKYGSRAARFVAFEAGAAAQNLGLQAAALRLGTVVVGAFDGEAVARALDMPADETAVVLMPIGGLVPG